MPHNSHSRKPAAHADESARAAPLAPLDLWAEQARHQMECGLQNMAALLQAGEELGQAQLQIAQQALKRHQALQQQLHEAEDLPQLLRLQAELLRLDPSATARYWHDCIDTTMRLGSQLVRSQMDLLNTGRSDAVRTAFQTVQTAMNPALRPLDGLFAMPGMAGMPGMPGMPDAASSGAGRPH